MDDAGTELEASVESGYRSPLTCRGRLHSFQDTLDSGHKQESITFGQSRRFEGYSFKDFRMRRAARLESFKSVKLKFALSL